LGSRLLKYKTAKTDVGGKDVMWESGGNEKWNFYVPNSFDDNSKGTLICNDKDQCITARSKKANLDESLKLTPKTEVGYQDNSWKLTKYGDNYTICTDINLVGENNTTKICMQPFWHVHNNNIKTRLNTVIARWGYNNNVPPPKEYFWEIKGIPNDFEGLK
jgi:hypothetical protein